jgi:MinD superfamily P-loop ATPase
MSIVHIRACDLKDDDPMKNVLEGMNKQEEQNVIISFKEAIEKGQCTVDEACHELEQFMGLWEGNRKFHLIPAYIASLK